MTEASEYQPKNRAERRAMKYKLKQLDSILQELERDKKLGLKTYASRGFGTNTGTKNGILRNREM
jgi:hypothetical protein